jgi:hypothetical protein
MLLLDYKGKLLPFQGVRTYKGSRTIAPLILPGTRYRQPPITQYIGGWVGPRTGVGVFEKEKNPSSLPVVAHRTIKHNSMRVAVHAKFCENLSRVSKVKMERHRHHVMKIRTERRSGDSWILQTVKPNQTYVIYTHLPVSNTVLCNSSGLWLSHTSFDR